MEIELDSIPLNNRERISAQSFRKRNVTPWENEHKDLADGGFRGAIFGFSDGLATNLMLILGVQFALDDSSSRDLVATGIAGLLAGAFSMVCYTYFIENFTLIIINQACGEYISMKAQSEAMENEIRIEKRHLRLFWDEEMESLKKTLSSKNSRCFKQFLLKISSLSITRNFPSKNWILSIGKIAINASWHSI